jgi:hypothetical protein
MIARDKDQYRAQQAHLPDGGLGVLAAEMGSGGEPGGAGGVPVGVEVVGGRGVQLPRDGAADPQRVRHAREPSPRAAFIRFLSAALSAGY